jgi:hypothetical protein
MFEKRQKGQTWTPLPALQTYGSGTTGNKTKGFTKLWSQAPDGANMHLWVFPLRVDPGDSYSLPHNGMESMRFPFPSVGMDELPFNESSEGLGWLE